MYLNQNQEYWKRGYKGYKDEYIESFIFRPFGRVIENYFSDIKSGKKKMLDFGCGSGAPTQFYKSKGFDVFGVDISKKNIECCQNRMPEINDHFQIIDPTPKEDTLFYEGQFDLVTAIQSLYYFSDSDLEIALKSIYNQMNPGAIIYATMIGTKCWCYNHATPFEDGLYEFKATTQRDDIGSHYVNFTKDENDLLKKFHLFEKMHVGFHSEQYREEDGVDFHYTYFGRKS